MQKRRRGKERKELNVANLLEMAFKGATGSRIKPPVPSSLLSGKKTLSQAEQKLNEPPSSD